MRRLVGYCCIFCVVIPREVVVAGYGRAKRAMIPQEVVVAGYHRANKKLIPREVVVAGYGRATPKQIPPNQIQQAITQQLPITIFQYEKAEE